MNDNSFHEIMACFCVNAATVEDLADMLPNVGWVTQAEADQAAQYIERETLRILEEWPLSGQTRH